MMDTIVNIASWILIISGSFFAIVGAVGTLRFPDFWSRLHAASITDSAGVILLLIGMMLQAGPGLIAVKLLIILIFLFITGPTSTHAVANAALVSGLKPRQLPSAKPGTHPNTDPNTGADPALKSENQPTKGDAS
ncbi:MAG: monovalent cation/H(+) antiporter subunit G [Rhodobacteraceae bacterium]|nr:monovalent cation/H(+) antiporter subunit G [Paracoccaceae bacterium]